MSYSKEDFKKYIKAGIGEIKADIVIKNCKYADVFNKCFKDGNIAIYKDKIIGIGDDYTAETVIDGNGGYLCPSFIDAHLHIESSMVTPDEYARVILPKGITTIIADPHEITNVCGIDGINFMKKCAENVPLDINFMIPSCVPATNFENSGAILSSKEVKELIDKGDTIGLGEMMNYPGVVFCDDDTIEKLMCSPFTDGHAPLISGKQLNGYICGGIATDHECSNIDEVNEKISKGMYVQLREGTCSKNLEDLLPAVNENNYDRILFCSDDRYLGDIVNEGTINYCVKKAVEKGIKPIYAVIMASKNVADCYGLKHLGAIAPNYFADLVLIKDFESMDILKVMKKGKIVAESGKSIYKKEDKKAENGKVTNSVKRISITEDTFKIPEKEKYTAIKLLPHNLITKKVTINKNDEKSKVCVIERHNKKESVGLGYVVNYGIKNGAIASTIGHDSHNIIVIGDNDSDMLKAVETLGTKGGISVVSNGEVKGYLELNIAGLISEKPFEMVLEEHTKLHKAAEKLNINKEIDPFMMLAFIPLPVIPEIRLTDKGLFDVVKFEFCK